MSKMLFSLLRRDAGGAPLPSLATGSPSSSRPPPPGTEANCMGQAQSSRSREPKGPRKSDVDGRPSRRSITRSNADVARLRTRAPGVIHNPKVNADVARLRTRAPGARTKSRSPPRPPQALPRVTRGAPQL
eukprot:6429498-Prymnesium_polylepis.1